MNSEMDDAKDIAIDVLTRLPKVNSLRDAFIAIGHADLLSVSRDIWMPYGWENFTMDKKVEALTKVIEKAQKALRQAIRRSEMRMEVAGILAVAKEVLAGGAHKAPGADRYGPTTHITHPSKTDWRPKTPATPKAPDEAQRKQWREDAAKRRKEEGIQPRKTT